MPGSLIAKWGRIETNRAKIRPARLGKWGGGGGENGRENPVSPAPRAFFAFLLHFLTVLTERLFTTILGAWNRLSFVQISSIYWKTAAEVWNWNQRGLWRNETRISVRNISLGNTLPNLTYPGIPLLPEIFRWEADPKSRVPFTFRPDFSENVCKWWRLLTIYKYFRPPRSLIPLPPPSPFLWEESYFY